MPGLIDTSMDGSTGLITGQAGDPPTPGDDMLDFGVETNSMYIAVVI